MNNHEYFFELDEYAKKNGIDLLWYLEVAIEMMLIKVDDKVLKETFKRYNRDLTMIRQIKERNRKENNILL